MLRPPTNLKKRYARHRLLVDGCSDQFQNAHRRKYDPDFHPSDILAYFANAYEQIEDPERFTTDKGVIGYITKPVRPPSQAAYAAMIGVRRETIWAWGEAHAEFGEALAISKAFQEALLIELGTVGGLIPSFTNFVLKNLQGWTDRIEETHKGNVALQFDAQDGEA